MRQTRHSLAAHRGTRQSWAFGGRPDGWDVEQASYSPPPMGSGRLGAVRRGMVRVVTRTALLGVVVLAGSFAPFAQAGIGTAHAAPFGVAAAAGAPGGSLPTQAESPRAGDFARAPA